MIYKLFVVLLCLGIVILMGGITCICCLNKEHVGYKVLLIGGTVTGIGLVGIVYTVFSLTAAIVVGLVYVLYAIVMILTS